MCDSKCGCGHCGKGCTTAMIAKILVIVGAVNWGLVGAGMLMGKMGDWNVVSMLLGSMPMVEGIVYVLVGVAGVSMIFGCKCKKCAGGVCMPESKDMGNTTGGNM